jgi:hypothetical protein
MKKTKSVALILGVLAMSFLVGYLVLAWTEPSQTPPGGNVLAPLNVGNVAQTKTGGLILNTGGAPIGLIVDKGNVGIGKMAPAQKLDVGGNIQGITGIFTGSGAVTSLLTLGTVQVGWMWGSAGIILFDGAGTNQIQTAGNNNLGIMPGGTGNVGIGTTAPSYKLDVSGTGRFTGDITGPGFYYASDESLKKNIQEIETPLAKIMKLNGISFDWKESGEKSIGLIAQDVEKVFPEIVKTDEETGLKTIEYAKLVAPLIEAVKEQQKMIDEQRELIDKQGEEIKMLKLYLKDL